MIDHNAWIGRWPFRDLGPRGNLGFLLEAMDRLEIQRAWVSPLNGILYRTPHAANRWLHAELAGHHDRFDEVPLFHPGLADGVPELKRILKQVPKVSAVRLLPALHAYDCGSRDETLTELANSGLSVILTLRLIDGRARHPQLPLPELPIRAAKEWVDRLSPARVILAGCLGNELRHFQPDPPANLAIESSFLDGPDCLEMARALLGEARVLPGSNTPINFQESLFAKWRQIAAPQSPQ